MPSFVNIGGQRFGRLIAVAYVDTGINEPSGRRVMKWRCVCDCGGSTEVSPAKLKNGNTTSCGCFQIEARSSNHLVHGMTNSPEFTAWQHMQARCYNKNDTEWHNYGGRGISVCAEWRASFAVFFEYIGPRLSSKHSIDRYPNNDGDYDPGNVRWATAREQRLNQRPKTHCMRGHLFTPKTTLFRENRNQRECRICLNARETVRRK